MNISAISKFKNTGLAIMAAGILSACQGGSVAKKTEAYFQDKPQLEYQEFVNDCKNRKLNKCQAQGKLDSLAYRDLFNATEAVNKSEVVKEFNEIAKNSASVQNVKDLFDHLSATNISRAEYLKVIENSTEEMMYGWTSSSDVKYSQVQHRADSIYYRNFFEKHGLLDSANLTKFNEITEKLRP